MVRFVFICSFLKYGIMLRVSVTGLETNARPLARGELNTVRASGLSDLTSPLGEWEFHGDVSTIGPTRLVPGLTFV